MTFVRDLLGYAGIGLYFTLILWIAAYGMNNWKD